VTLDADHLNRLRRAAASLDGLSTGDAFGERFFGHPDVVGPQIGQRALPPPPWRYTDDTVMAISILDVLTEKRGIDQDLLAELFAARFKYDTRRGYGSTARTILTAIGEGKPWYEVSQAAFGGGGSMGNGAAMRAAPLGAYFADDYEAVVENARLSAEITHAHPDGKAGAIAVAVAAACVAHGPVEPRQLFDTVLRLTPESETRAGIRRASTLRRDIDAGTAAFALGSGSRVLAQDTVPFCLWCAAGRLGDFEAAMWHTVSGFGDRDTTCAIVGGILAGNTATQIPSSWLEAREPLENMARDKIASIGRKPA